MNFSLKDFRKHFMLNIFTPLLFLYDTDRTTVLSSIPNSTTMNRPLFLPSLYPLLASTSILPPAKRVLTSYLNFSLPQVPLHSLSVLEFMSLSASTSHHLLSTLILYFLPSPIIPNWDNNLLFFFW